MAVHDVGVGFAFAAPNAGEATSPRRSIEGFLYLPHHRREAQWPIKPNARRLSGLHWKMWTGRSPLCFSNGSSGSKRHNPQKTMKNQLRFGLVVKLGLQRFMHQVAMKHSL